MTTFNKKAPRGTTTAIRIRKPRYYYQDIVDKYFEDTTKNIELTKFEGLDYDVKESFITFKNKTLWNNVLSPLHSSLLAPYIEDKAEDFLDINEVGTLIKANNIYTGFTTSSYLYLEPSYKNIGNTYIIKFTTSGNISSKQCVVHSEGFLRCEIQSNRILLDGTNVYPATTYTTYWLKCVVQDASTRVWSYSTNGKDFVEETTISASANTSSTYQIRFGISSYSLTDLFTGFIDFNETKILNGEEVVWDVNKTKKGLTELPKYLATKKGFDYKVVGNPINDDYVYSGFSANDYLSLPVLKFGQGSWEFTIKATPAPEDLTNENAILNAEQDSRGVRIGTAGTVKGRWEFLVSSGSGWINTSSHYGSHNVEANTTYWLKAGFDATNNRYYLKYSTNGEDYIDDVSYTSGTKAHETNHNIGRSINSIYWRGSIDITNASLVADGVEVWGQNGISVTETNGCLDGFSHKNSQDNTYIALSKFDNILLKKKDEVVEGYTWAGEVNVPKGLMREFYLKDYRANGTLNVNALYEVNGFKNTNYIFSTNAIDLNKYKKWSIEARVRITTTGRYQYWFCGPFLLGFDNSQYLSYFGTDTNLKSTTQFNGNTWYWFKLEKGVDAAFFNGTPYKLYYKVNEEDEWMLCGETAVDTNSTYNITPVVVGINSANTSEYLYGDIDLKEYKIIGDGETIWKPLKEDVPNLDKEWF